MCLYCFPKVKVQEDLVHGSWVGGNWGDGSDCLVPDKLSGLISSYCLDGSVFEVKILWQDLGAKDLLSVGKE